MRHPDRLKVPSILQLIVASIGILGSLALGFLMLLFGLVSVFGPESDTLNSIQFIAMGWVAVFVLALLIPSLLYAIRRLNFRPIPEWPVRGFRFASFAMVFWLFLLAAGEFATKLSFAWLILPPIQLLVVAIPLWWLVEFGRRGLRAGSQQRTWGLLGTSLVITVPVTLVIELLIFGVFILAAAIWLSGQPALVRQFQDLVQRISIYDSNPEMLQQMLLPYLQQGWVSSLLLVTMAGLVPLLEELIKPLALWGMAGWKLKPSEGFVGGLICGAGFALLETSIALSSVNQRGWWILGVERVGTGILHILTSGLVGWGLASAWTDKRYFRLAGGFLSAIALHSAWNAIGLGLGVIPLIGTNLTNINGLAIVQTALLITQAVAMVAVIYGMNRYLNRKNSGIILTEIPDVITEIK